MRHAHAISEELTALVLGAAAGSILGSFIAEWGERRFRAPADSAAVVRRWSLVGVVFVALVLLAREVT